jgi:predicted secreted protein
MTMPHRIVRSLGLLGLLATSLSPLAQTVVLSAPQNVVSLSAEASREVPQDWLSIVLGTTREGADAAAVQGQLRQALDAALTEARKAARPEQLELRTGSFSMGPRYSSRPGNGNAITGWQGQAELVIEGLDVPAISQLAGKLKGLQVLRLGFGLSRQAREKVEAEVSAQAIDRFKAKAETYARQFGFGSYSLREVSVSGGDVAAGAVPQLRQAMAGAAPMGDMAQPVEAGKAMVTVTVSGSVQLSPR